MTRNFRFTLSFTQVFCGVIGRLAMLSEVLADVRETASRIPHQALFGDLNTMQHGIARLSRDYCDDTLRWRLPVTESEWLHENVVSYTVDDGPTNSLVESFFYDEGLLEAQATPISFLMDALQLDNSVHIGTTVITDLGHASPPTSPIGMSYRYHDELDTIFTNLRSPQLIDLFPTSTETLRAYAGLYRGKLDWTLVRRLIVHSTSIHNNDYSASDHKMLAVVVEFDEEEGSWSRARVDEMRTRRLQVAIERGEKQVRTTAWRWWTASAMVTGAVAITAGYFLRRHMTS